MSRARCTARGDSPPPGDAPGPPRQLSYSMMPPWRAAQHARSDRSTLETHMERQAIHAADRPSRFSEYWSPKIVAEMNDDRFSLVKVQDEIVSHRHAGADEVLVPTRT